MACQMVIQLSLSFVVMLVLSQKCNVKLDSKLQAVNHSGNDSWSIILTQRSMPNKKGVVKVVQSLRKWRRIDIVSCCWDKDNRTCNHEDRSVCPSRWTMYSTWQKPVYHVNKFCIIKGRNPCFVQKDFTRLNIF